MLRWLVNIGLLAVPIAATLGILMGINTHREATGQAPLFVDNSVVNNTYCQKAFGIHPTSKGQEYTLNPNQWGWNEGEPGRLCMNVTTHNNNTYATNTTAPKFSVTWSYPQGSETQPVHAFPNIKVDGSAFPITVQNAKQIKVDIEWTYGIGNDSAITTNSAQLEGNVNANVAIDMFIDSDQNKAQDSTKATYEVMVWLAAFGPATQPIGLAQGALATEIINGTTFSLYSGQNSLKQYVLSWVATQTTEKFHGDLTPLLARTVGLGRPNLPTSSDYLGYMGLGSETLYTTSSATFTVPQLSIDVRSA